MPKPIVCLSEQLCQFLEVFRHCFSKRQWKYFVTILLGLIECEERKSIGDAGRKLQDEHRRNLLIWLQEQFQTGCTIEQISLQLALCNS